jgi:hypothetical protein
MLNHEGRRVLARHDMWPDRTVERMRLLTRVGPEPTHWRAGGAHSGDIDEDIQPALLAPHACEQLGHLSVDAGVEADGYADAARAPDQRGRLFDGCCTTSVIPPSPRRPATGARAIDRRPCLAESPGDRPPHAPGRAHDHGNPATEGFHGYR